MLEQNRHKKLRVVLLTMAPVPVGNVSTLRFMSYLEALAKKGIFAKVIVYTPTNMAKNININCGEFRGVEYEYATKVTWPKNSNFLIKVFYFLKGLITSAKLIKNAKSNIILLYGDNPSVVNFFLWGLSKVLKCSFIGDRSEYPSIDVRQSKIRLLNYNIKNSLFDGMIVMTKQLDSFYKKLIKKNNPTFLMPMTTDIHRFDNVVKISNANLYIAVVFGTHNRDGLYESLKAYFEYRKQGGTFSLKLIGDFEGMPNKKSLNGLISDSCYEVSILGQLPIDEVPEILYNASCLLTTPNYYVSGGFPTKLGEYMLSGVPVVATNVGELSDFVTDKEDIIFAEAGNIKDIASKLKWVEQHKSEALTIADNAKKTANARFSAESYVAGLIAYLSSKHS